MERIESYLAMGGYAAYVWPALGVALLVMAGQVATSLRSLRRREAALAELETRLGRRATPAAR
ncbi:MAG TPA: heme exporter protein CcmD [Dongiaceae bacterium]|nr:heme exporter protein CcmD [Dongiaceae bacterium]